MSDLIDRQALLDECLNHYEVGNIEQNCTMDWICKTVRSFPAAQRWVRCEEQLPPNDGKEVLVTDGVHVGIGICLYKWSKTKKWTREAVWRKWNLNDYGYPMKKFKTDTHIKAWMPLPEPPKEDA